MASSSTCSPPDTVYVKTNPCCVLIREIAECEDIGNSLANINFNFSNLDAHTCNLEASGSELWTPTYSLVESQSANWQAAYAVVQSMSAAWNAAYTTVSQYSAAFLEPVTVMYPTPNTAGYVTYDTTAIATWLSTTLPITSTAAGPNCPTANFAPNQKAWVMIANTSVAAQVLLAQVTSTSSLIAVFMHIWIKFPNQNVIITQSGGAIPGTYPLIIPNVSGQWIKQLKTQSVPGANQGGDANTLMAWGYSPTDNNVVWAGCNYDHVYVQSSTTQVTGTYYDYYISSFTCLEYVNVAGVWTFVAQRY